MPSSATWRNADKLDGRSWTCGYCGRSVGGNVGYSKYVDDGSRIYVCPHCDRPTAFVPDDAGLFGQFPCAACGGEVDGLPPSVAALYSEVRRCVQYNAHTAAVLAMRKLLMHVAVYCGADEGRSFSHYVSYLDDEHWIPPNGRGWVDALRAYGNEATHEIVLSDERDARQLLDFAEMLLRIVYEFPGKVRER